MSSAEKTATAAFTRLKEANTLNEDLPIILGCTIIVVVVLILAIVSYIRNKLKQRQRNNQSIQFYNFPTSGPKDIPCSSFGSSLPEWLDDIGRIFTREERIASGILIARYCSRNQLFHYLFGRGIDRLLYLLVEDDEIKKSRFKKIGNLHIPRVLDSIFRNTVHDMTLPRTCDPSRQFPLSPEPMHVYVLEAPEFCEFVTPEESASLTDRWTSASKQGRVWSIRIWRVCLLNPQVAIPFVDIKLPVPVVLSEDHGQMVFSNCAETLCPQGGNRLLISTSNNQLGFLDLQTLEYRVVDAPDWIALSRLLFATNCSITSCSCATNTLNHFFPFDASPNCWRLLSQTKIVDDEDYESILTTSALLDEHRAALTAYHYPPQEDHDYPTYIMNFNSLLYQPFDRPINELGPNVKEVFDLHVKFRLNKQTSYEKLGQRFYHKSLLRLRPKYILDDGDDFHTTVDSPSEYELLEIEFIPKSLKFLALKAAVKLEGFNGLSVEKLLEIGVPLQVAEELDRDRNLLKAYKDSGYVYEIIHP